MIPSSRLLRAPIASGSRQLLSSTPAPSAVSALARQCRPASTVSPSPTRSMPKTSISGSNATVTTLDNKMRVVTEATPGHFHAVGVYIDAGSRFESRERSGVSHLIDRLAFKSTDKHTDDEMTTLIDSMGAQISCASSRETIMYQSSIFPQHLPTALSILSSTILHPLLLPTELESQKQAAAYEIREIWSKPELILPEVLHTVAYKGNTLGMPLLCPEEQLAVLGEKEVRGFMDEWYRPERMVLAGSGMAHEELVELAQKYFGGLRTETTSSIEKGVSLGGGGISGSGVRGGKESQVQIGRKNFATVSSVPADTAHERIASQRAVYTGGEEYIEKPEEEFVHLYIGFEGLGIHDPDIYALATLQTLLGGGGSFSAGGPGKGMYTRLYTSVLNRYHSVDFCQAFHHCYVDSGLFGISAAVYPKFVPRIAEVIAQQLHSLTGPMRGGLEEIEVSRAKNMLKSTLVMALESRLTAVEDLGRQTQVHGNKVPVEEMCAKIDALTMEDLWRTANRILRPPSGYSGLNFGLGSGKPTIVAQGQDLTQLGDVKRTLRRWDLGKE